METLGFLRDIAVVLGAALVAGVASQRMRQPVLVGYLLAGMLIGPSGLRLIGDEATVSHLAELGVILLMFALGVEFSLAQFRPVRWLVLVGGGLYMALAVGGTALAGLAFGYSLPTGLLVGFVLALSSTIIVMRILIDRRAIDSVHGKTMLGWLILQDLAVVPMLVLVPYLAVDGGWGLAVLTPIVVALAKVGLFLAAMYALGTTLFPRILQKMAETGHQELFFLAVIGLCFGTAAASAAFGLSLALGAFLAGLVVSQSDEHRQVLADVLPLRDLFVTLFFVSIGMLIDPAFLAANGPAIAVMGLALMGGKAMLGTAVALGLRLSWRTSLLIGLGLAQIGEFSFVLAREGRAAGLLTTDQFSLLLAAALLTMLLTPTLMRLAPRLAAWASRVAPAGQDPAQEDVPALHDHVVLVGYGRVGAHLGGILIERGTPFLVIDLDPHTLDGLAEHGVQTLYGDGAMGEVLAHAGLEKARLLVVAMPDPSAAKLAVQHACRINPKLEIVLAAHPGDDPATYLEAGAAEVIRPELEAARALVRSCLVRLGWSPNVIQYYLARMRAIGDPMRDLSAALAGIADSPDGTAAMWLSLSDRATAGILRKRDVAERTGVEVLVVRPRGQTTPIMAPAAEQALEPGDALLVLGTPSQLTAVVRLLAGPAARDGPRAERDLTSRSSKHKKPRPPSAR
jgi:CPA2 family monovalent cation:H+ antiporter-2